MLWKRPIPKNSRIVHAEVGGRLKPEYMERGKTHKLGDVTTVWIGSNVLPSVGKIGGNVAWFDQIGKLAKVVAGKGVHEPNIRVKVASTRGGVRVGR